MALANHIHRENSGRYHARLRVPQDLIGVIGKRELWKACNTTDPETAKDEKARIIAEWRAWFRELRQRRAAEDCDIQRAVYDFYRRECEADRANRLTWPTKADVEGEVQKLRDEIERGEAAANDIGRIAEVVSMRDARKSDMAFREAEREALSQHLGDGETALIEWAADDIIAREKFDIGKGSPAYRDLCNRLLRAKLQVLDRATERDRGQYDGKPTDEVAMPQAGGRLVAVAPPGEGIMELYEEYARQVSGKVRGDTLEQNRKIIQRFAEFVGESAPVSEIDKKAVREWKMALYRWPLKASEIGEFRGMTFKAIIKANEAANKAVIQPKTINKYLSALGAFCRWLISNGYLHGANPVGDMYLGLDKEEKKVFPFTVEQLRAVFSSPVFKGARSSEDDLEPGNFHITDWRRWVPLIGLFTGARLGEICQLYLEDVRQSNGHWIFHITREGARDGDVKKSTKTKGSMRVVPIHAELIRMGFLEYHAALSARGEKRLFPEVRPDVRGHISGYPSRWWGRYLISLGIKSDSSVNFHSFRHGLTDALRRAGFLDTEFKFLMGHTQATTTGRYGVLQEGELKRRKTLIDAVEFPGLDLSHLYVAGE